MIKEATDLKFRSSVVSVTADEIFGDDRSSYVCWVYFIYTYQSFVHLIMVLTVNVAISEKFVIWYKFYLM